MKCNLILDLANHICGKDAARTAWLLNWLALPLQRNGHRMQSIVLSCGEQGSGKSLFWEHVVAPLHGEVGALPAHRLIEPFNAWARRSLVLVDGYNNTLLSKQVVTAIKFSMSSEFVEINEKAQKTVRVKSAANFVLMSDDKAPKELINSRRVAVLNAHGSISHDDFTAIKQQIQDGGLVAFKKHLLNLNVAGFDEYSVPSHPVVWVTP